MVLSQRLADQSPLALLRLRRAEADEALRRSLGTASMLALTACVAFLLARALLYVPVEVRIIDLGDVLPPINTPMPPPIPTGGFAPPRVAPPDARGQVIPVDRDVPELTDRMVPPSDAIHDGPPSVGPVGNDGPARGPATVAEPAEPRPTDFVYYEKLPMPLHQVKPDYPPIALQAGMEGKVVVRLLLGPDGTVRRAEVEKSSPMFDEYALMAARQWTFTPAMTDGKPVMAWVRVPFDFRLH